MFFTVDEINNNIAVLEDDMLDKLPVPLSLLPEGVREGSILSFDGEKYVLCLDDEAQKRKKLFELQNKLLHKNKKFPIDIRFVFCYTL